MDGGFPSEPKPRCDRCQNLSPQGDEEQAPTYQDHYKVTIKGRSILTALIAASNATMNTFIPKAA
jgi:hypothetical protein